MKFVSMEIKICNKNEFVLTLRLSLNIIDTNEPNFHIIYYWLIDKLNVFNAFTNSSSAHI